MRSYYAHLKQVYSKEKTPTTKPIFRASAIFPVINAEEISTRLIFLSYWHIKRNIQDITQLTTLRDEKGSVLYRDVSEIKESKAFRIELKDLLASCNHDPSKIFHGSLEIEFFSSKPLFYPYPAVSINFYGKNYSSVVHTAQRVYNDFEDMQTNSLQKVPEGGFNIYANEHQEPFIGLVNGPIEEEQAVIDFTFVNADNETMHFEHLLGKLTPYETRIIYPAREVPLAKFLKGKAGTVKAKFSLQWIYPRLLVGNIQNDPKILSITHSYYDCSDAKEKTDFWLEETEGWHAAALMIPLKVSSAVTTDICLYPIYSPGKFTLDFEIYDSKGTKLGEKANAINFDGKKNKYLTISVKSLLEELAIPFEEDLGLRVIARQHGQDKIPARVKISLDIGDRNKAIPCNICTNLIPYNPDWIKKKSTLHWMPLLADTMGCSAWILNSNPQYEFKEEATITLIFYRESDTKTLERSVKIPPNGFLTITPDDDVELSHFFQGQIGWLTLQSSNPYVSTYYFSANDSGAYGGDHGY